MDKKMRNHYQVPTIKVVACQVEGGFQASRHKIGDSPSQGTQDYDVLSGDDLQGWGVSYSNNSSN